LEEVDEMNENQLKVFTNPKFGTVRTTLINGAPYVVGKDLMKILGYSENESQEVLDYSAIFKNVAIKCNITNNLGIEQETILLSKTGIRLTSRAFAGAMESTDYEKLKITDWIEIEVIPATMKGG